MKKYFVTSLLLFLAVISAEGWALNIGIAENQDDYTQILGLSDFLKDEDLAFKDFSSDFENGIIPDLKDIDLFIIGSFLTNDTDKNITYTKSGEVFKEFVSKGGAMAIFCQADQDCREEDWMEKPRRISRNDSDFGYVFAYQPKHILLNSPETISQDDLKDWRVPNTWKYDNTAWESFNGFSEGGAIIVPNQGDISVSCLVEMGWGKGRVLFYAMAPDKAYTSGNGTSKTASVKFLHNLLYYAEQVKNDSAPDIEISTGTGYQFPVKGFVFTDLNSNEIKDENEPGHVGIGVSDGSDVVLTSSDGSYTLPNENKDAVFVYVCQPDYAVKTPKLFYQLISKDNSESDKFNFFLQIKSGKQTKKGSYFVQITDIHTVKEEDRDLQIKTLREIYDLDQKPDFLVATGDLVNQGTKSQLDNYTEGMSEPPFPYYNVIGNHDIYSGSIAFYQSYFGPDYFSFDDGGVHYVARNVITKSPRQSAWLENDLKILGKDKPVVFFQHYPPTTEDMAQFESWGIHSIFSGHWHSEKVVQSGDTVSVNSPAFLMGGIDCGPAGFKLVHITPDGEMKTEWRYGLQDKKLTIVYPQNDSIVNKESFQILVNAYDTSVKVKNIKWSLNQSEKTKASGILTQDSPISWSGIYKESKGLNLKGKFEFLINVEDSNSEIWSAKNTIQLQSKKPYEINTENEWPMFMGNASHSEIVKNPLSLPMELAWSIDSGGDLDFSSPIFAEGRLYIAMKRRGTERDNGIIAINPSDGKIIWKVSTSQSINHSPAYESGVLCITEVGGRVYGLEAATGKEIWQTDLLDNLGRYNFGTPCADDGKFYVGTTHQLACIEAKNGKVYWNSDFGSDWITSCSSPAVENDFLALGGMWHGENSFLVINKKDGKKIWGHSVDSGMHSSPTIINDKILIGSRNSILYCCNIENGTVIWKQSIGESTNSCWMASTPAVKDEIIIAGSGDGIVKAINFNDGSEIWKFKSDSAIFKLSPYRRDDKGLLSSPAIVSNKVFFGSADGHLYCLDLKTGKELWSYDLGVPVLSTPLVTGNALFVGSYNGRVYAFASKI